MFESGGGASLRRLLCLCAWRPCLSGERGSNAVFVRILYAEGLYMELCAIKTRTSRKMEDGGIRAVEKRNFSQNHLTMVLRYDNL